MDISISGNIIKCNNKPWPPFLGATVAISHPEYNDILFLGYVYKYIWNTKGAIIILLNNVNYTDNSLVEHKIVQNKQSAKGLFLLVSNYGWKYINDSKLSENSGLSIEEIESIKSKLKTKLESSIIIGDYPMTQIDLTTKGLYNKNKKKEEKMCNVDDDMNDESILTPNGEIDIDKLFKENDIKLYDPNEEFTAISPEIQLLLQKKLKLGEKIDDEKTRIVVNKNIAIKNIINSKEDEINEGNKIMNWIGKNVQNIQAGNLNIFDDLKMAIHNGYVHIGRKGIDVNDVISTDLVGKLNYFEWQNNIPINYDTLKYLMFQTQFQKGLQNDANQRKEMEKILSQEYLICIHPQPKYLMFTIKRLLIAMYSDNKLTKNIRKIKILINQWRAKNNEPYNKKFGILPMIVIYPRYGKESARNCVESIVEYFALYNNMAWTCSTPSYFIKVNDLIYYTNGHLDLKLYFRTVLKEHQGNVTNESFEDDLSKIIDADNVLLFE
jgi:hypothetical protein